MGLTCSAGEGGTQGYKGQGRAGAVCRLDRRGRGGEQALSGGASEGSRPTQYSAVLCDGCVAAIAVRGDRRWDGACRCQRLAGGVGGSALEVLGSAALATMSVNRAHAQVFLSQEVDAPGQWEREVEELGRCGPSLQTGQLGERRRRRLGRPLSSCARPCRMRPCPCRGELWSTTQSTPQHHRRTLQAALLQCWLTGETTLGQAEPSLCRAGSAVERPALSGQH